MIDDFRVSKNKKLIITDYISPYNEKRLSEKRGLQI